MATASDWTLWVGAALYAAADTLDVGAGDAAAETRLAEAAWQAYVGCARDVHARIYLIESIEYALGLPDASRVDALLDRLRAPYPDVFGELTPSDARCALDVWTNHKRKGGKRSRGTGKFSILVRLINRLLGTTISARTYKAQWFRNLRTRRANSNGVGGATRRALDRRGARGCATMARTPRTR